MFNHQREGEVMSNVTTVGIDLAKNVFSVHALSGSREHCRDTKALDLNGSHDTPLVNLMNRLAAAARS
jgi:hypothetical protein